VVWWRPEERSEAAVDGQRTTRRRGVGPLEGDTDLALGTAGAAIWKESRRAGSYY
jgi:hypothetical protein